MENLKFEKDDLVDFIESNSGSAINKAVLELEKALIQEALIMHWGNQTKAAEVLGMNRGTLRARMRMFGMFKKGKV